MEAKQTLRGFSPMKIGNKVDEENKIDAKF